MTDHELAEEIERQVGEKPIYGKPMIALSEGDWNIVIAALRREPERQLSDRVNQLERELAGLRADAERYRWLVGRLFERSLYLRGLGAAIQLVDASGNALGSSAGADAAIDAAMKGKT